MDIRQLRYFLTICEEGQITAAAKKLHMAQPPLSQQLKALENELGVILIKRGNRSIRLTDAGELLKERAIAILQLCDASKKEVQDNQGSIKKNLSIGIVTSSHNVFLANGIQEFHRDYPNTVFTLREGNTFQVMDMLEKGICDLGVVRTPFPQSKFQVLPISKEPMAAVVNVKHNPFSSEVITLQDLENKPLIYYERYAALLEELFMEKGFLPNVLCRNQDARTTLLWAKTGMGIGIVPKSAITLIDASDLAVLNIEERRLETQIMMIYIKERYVSDIAAAFLSYYQ